MLPNYQTPEHESPSTRPENEKAVKGKISTAFSHFVQCQETTSPSNFVIL